MEIFANIKAVRYTPLLCRSLDTYEMGQLESILSEKRGPVDFILRIDDKNKLAVSRWVSAKRTRSYPYARVYNTLSFAGKKVTIIPVFKDEGEKGDRDFLQWDTVSLMSLLGVYVIISYYADASVNPRLRGKITDQRFDFGCIKSEIRRLLSYQSDALHWNLEQIDKIAEIAKIALESYEGISQKLSIKMHSKESALKRIAELSEGKEKFKSLSRGLAHKAQERESVTTQPKEHLAGTKAVITIKNYLGGYYYFTSDEVELKQNEVYLIEGKHTKSGKLPSEDDIKDGLLRMALFANLDNVEIDGQAHKPVAVLKLTTGKKFDESALKGKQKAFFETLKREAATNGFRLSIDGKLL
jgi:hypothetical protein